MRILNYLPVFFRKRSRGAIRVALYGAVVSAGIVGLSIHSARADVVKASYALGGELEGVADKANPGDVTKIRLNGQDMSVSLSYSDANVSGVLDRLEAHCAQDPGGLKDGWKDAPNSALEDRLSKEMAAGMRRGVLRDQQSEEMGMIVCFRKGDGTPPTFLEAATLFGRTQDLGAFGKVRFARVKKSAKGTRVTLMWTEDHFNIGELIPEEGKDAKGSDSADVPRPLDSNRLLTAEVLGTPYGNRLYRAKGEPAGIGRWYEQQMFDRGWITMSPKVEGGDTRGFYKDGVVVMVSTVKDAETPGHSIVSMGLSGLSDREGVSPVPKLVR